MGLIIGSIVTAAGVASLFWVLAAVRVRPLVRGQPLLHVVTIYLTVLTFLLLNAFTFAAVFRLLDTFGISLLYGFMSGVQTVASIAAFLFVRNTRRQRLKR